MTSRWFPDVVLDRHSPLPLHVQIETLLRSAIATGVLADGERLPAEPALADHWDVARMTVRQAVESLVRDGLVLRRHGVGTFVLRPTLPGGHGAGAPAGASQSRLPVSERMLDRLRAAYLRALVDGQLAPLDAILERAQERGLDADGASLKLLQWSACKVGSAWEAGGLSIAREHRATEILTRHLAMLHARAAPPVPRNRRVVIGCVEGELHALGARMVADFLERAGWQAHYLGANTPTDTLVGLAKDVGAHLIGLSVTLSDRLPMVGAVAAARERAGIAAVPILVGGQAALAAPEHLHALGVLGPARDAADAVAMATATCASGVPALP